MITEINVSPFLFAIFVEAPTLVGIVEWCVNVAVAVMADFGDTPLALIPKITRYKFSSLSTPTFSYQSWKSPVLPLG